MEAYLQTSAASSTQLADMLSWMNTVVDSYCGSSVFVDEGGVTGYVDIASGTRALSLSSLRASHGEALNATMDALRLELSDAAASEILEQLASGSNEAMFWDVIGFHIARDMLVLPDLGDGLMSDVFELH